MSAKLLISLKSFPINVETRDKDAKTTSTAWGCYNVNDGIFQPPNQTIKWACLSAQIRTVSHQEFQIPKTW